MSRNTNRGDGGAVEEEKTHTSKRETHVVCMFKQLLLWQPQQNVQQTKAKTAAAVAFALNVNLARGMQKGQETAGKRDFIVLGKDEDLPLYCLAAD